MNFIDFNTQEIEELLTKLQENTQPKFGVMTPQVMVEHLEDVVHISLGKTEMEIRTPPEKIQNWQDFLASDQPIVPGFKAHFVKDDPVLRYTDLESAKKNLLKSIKEMMTDFKENQALIRNHPYFGPLNFEQWKRFHSKHFSHHFVQFEIHEY